MSMQLWSPSVEAELAYRREQAMAASGRGSRRARGAGLGLRGHVAGVAGVTRIRPVRRVGRTV